MSIALKWLIVIVAGYMMGNFSSGITSGMAFGSLDIRKYGSKSTGEFVGVHSVRSATVIADSLEVAASVWRSQPPEDGGSRELLIRAAVFHVVPGISCDLRVIDLQIAFGGINHHALYALDVQRCRYRRAHNIATNLFIGISEEHLQ